MSPEERTPMSIAHDDALVQAQSDGHRHVTKVTQARSKAQRTKIDHEASIRQKPEGVYEQNEEVTTLTPQVRRRMNMTVQRAINDYLDDHIGGMLVYVKSAHQVAMF